MATAMGATLLPRTLLAADRAPIRMPLWPDDPPDGGGPSGPIHRSAKGALSNIVVPQIDAFVPDNPNGMAFLIAGGGGYKRIEAGSESLPAATWLTARGITAFVLTYRLPGEGWTAGPLAPLQDAQRAIRLIRANAGRFSIDPDKVGVLGFSAGGHLMGLAATRSAFASYKAANAADGLSARPNFAALIYPIITLMPPYDHTSTRKILVGDHPSRDLSAEWSVEDHVQAHCPPVFLVQAKDDPISNPQNTVIMQAACEKAGVPVELHQLASGGHGFGMGRPGTASATWPQDFFAGWIEKMQQESGSPG